MIGVPVCSLMAMIFSAMSIAEAGHGLQGGVELKRAPGEYMDTYMM